MTDLIFEILIWAVMWCWLLILATKVDKLEKRLKKKDPETVGEALRVTRDQRAAFLEAGFTQEQASELLKEAIRSSIKQQGGWKP